MVIPIIRGITLLSTTPHTPRTGNLIEDSIIAGNSVYDRGKIIPVVRSILGCVTVTAMTKAYQCGARTGY